MAVPSPDRNKVECRAGEGQATSESATRGGQHSLGLIVPAWPQHSGCISFCPWITLQTSRSHVTEEEMEAAGGEVKCPDSHSRERGGGGGVSACLVVSPAGHSCVV